MGAAFYAWDIGVKRGDIRVLGAAIGVAILIATFGGVLNAHMSWFADEEIEVERGRADQTTRSPLSMR